MSAAGSELCRACGFCCSGMLFGALRLTEDEARNVTRMRLPIVEDEGGKTLLLPCPAHVGACTIYEERPSVCRAYHCQLVNEVERGEIDLGSALLRIERLRNLAEAIRPHLGGGAGGFWEKAAALQRRPFDWQIAHEELMIEITTLREMLARFLDARSRGTGAPSR